jgi:hypothetical protein
MVSDFFLFFVLFTLTSVVPQGTNLSPLLFYLVFISDICCFVNCDKSLSKKIYSPVESFIYRVFNVFFICVPLDALLLVLFKI